MATVEHITGERLLKVEETAAIIGAAVGTLNRARVVVAHGGSLMLGGDRGGSLTVLLDHARE
jgi:hypothetical protein